MTNTKNDFREMLSAAFVANVPLAQVEELAAHVGVAEAVRQTREKAEINAACEAFGNGGRPEEIPAQGRAIVERRERLLRAPAAPNRTRQPKGIGALEAVQRRLAARGRARLEA